MKRNYPVDSMKSITDILTLLNTLNIIKHEAFDSNAVVNEVKYYIHIDFYSHNHDPILYKTRAPATL